MNLLLLAYLFSFYKPPQVDLSSIQCKVVSRTRDGTSIEMYYTTSDTTSRGESLCWQVVYVEGIYIARRVQSEEGCSDLESTVIIQECLPNDVWCTNKEDLFGKETE